MRQKQKLNTALALAFAKIGIKSSRRYAKRISWPKPIGKTHRRVDITTGTVQGEWR